MVAGFPVARRRPALAPVRPADAARACRRGAGRARSGTCARPATSRRTRRWTPTTSTRSRSTPSWRRRGIAQRLLDDAPSARRARAGLRRLALDTGLHERARRGRCTTAYGFGEREIRRAPDDRTARALGGPGFVGYLKAV